MSRWLDLSIVNRCRSASRTCLRRQSEVDSESVDIVAQLNMAFTLVNYRYGIKTVQDPKDIPIEEVVIVDPNAEELLQSSTFKWYSKVAEAKNFARDLANARVNTFGIQGMLGEIEKIRLIRPEKVTLKTLIGKQLEEAGLGLHYAVGKGSIQQPAAVSLSFMNDPDNKKVTALVGKGLDFDSGGLHVKKYGYMEDMYIDKAGASATLATFHFAVEHNLKINLVCTVGLAENSISEDSYRPSDILKSHAGLTVEVGDTDAEGRLVLADVMSWTQTLHPAVTHLVELSTLTGASMVALGERTAAVFSNDDLLASDLLRSGTPVGERWWRLPLADEYREMLKGSHSDLNNVCTSKYGGAIEGAAFLENFVKPGVKWAHLDIAGPALYGKDRKGYQIGASGFGVGTLLHHFKTQVN